MYNAFQMSVVILNPRESQKPIKTKLFFMKAHGATQNFSRGGLNFLTPKDDQHPGFPGAHPDISKEKGLVSIHPWDAHHLGLNTPSGRKKILLDYGGWFTRIVFRART